MSYLWTLDIPSEEVLSSFLILISVTHAREPRSGPIVKPELDPLFGLSILLQEFYWFNINYLFKKEDTKFEQELRNSCELLRQKNMELN